MIQQVWDKKIVAQIEIHHNDIADDVSPLPLYLQLSWNHYIALYFDQIIAFFSSYAPYPWTKNQFYLSLQSQNLKLNGTQVIGHLVSMYRLGIEKPIKLICHFRNKLPLPTIQIRKFFKYSLKASTAIRNAKLGASILTLQMSIDNVQKLYESFVKNDIKEYLGSNDFQNGNLGFSFIISRTERIPIKIIGKQFVIQRGVDKNTSLGKFLTYVFQQAGTKEKQTEQKQQKPVNEISNIEQNQQSNQKEGIQQIQDISSEPQDVLVREKAKRSRENDIQYNKIFEKYSFYMHGIKIARGQYPLSFFQRFCHPDGFLYIFFKERS